MNRNTTSTPLIVALFGAIFMGVIGNTLPLIAGIYIVEELGGSNYLTTYVLSFFGIGNAFGVPLAKTLAKRFGSVNTLIFCLLLSALLNLVIAFSPTFFFFNLIRLLQGIAVGPMYVLVNQLLMPLIPQKRSTLFTTVFLAILIGSPALGASWGGILAYEYHWTWAFYINVPIFLGLAAVIKRGIKEEPSLPYEKAFNWSGYFFYCISIFCLGFVLTTGQEFDWLRSRLMNTLLLIGIPTFLFYLLWDYRHPHPVIDLKLFKNPIFSFALLNLALLFSAYFGMVILLALWLHLYVNYTPLWVSLLIGTMALAATLPKFLLQKEHKYDDSRIHLAIALLLLAISSFHTATFNVEINFNRIALSRILSGFGLAFFLLPIFRLAFFSFGPEKRLDILVAFQVVRSIASGLGGPLYVILWQRRQIFYHDRLGSQLTPFSEQTQLYFMQAKNFLLQGLASDAQLEDLLQRQATALALEDCFYLMGWLFVAMFFLLLLTLAMRAPLFRPETPTR